MPISSIKVDYEPGKAAIEGYSKQIEVPVTRVSTNPLQNSRAARRLPS